jgi:hypothetical protein
MSAWAGAAVYRAPGVNIPSNRAIRTGFTKGLISAPTGQADYTSLILLPKLPVWRKPKLARPFTHEKSIKNHTTSYPYRYDSPQHEAAGPIPATFEKIINDIDQVADIHFRGRQRSLASRH